MNTKQITVGADWMYDTEAYRGSFIVKNSDGGTAYYKPVFTLMVGVDRAKDTRYTSERRNDICRVKLIDYGESDLSLGVIRRALQMQMLEREGRLDNLIISGVK